LNVECPILPTLLCLLTKSGGWFSMGEQERGYGEHHRIRILKAKIDSQGSTASNYQSSRQRCFEITLLYTFI